MGGRRKGFVGREEGSEMEVGDATSHERNSTRTTSGSKKNPETPGNEKR